MSFRNCCAITAPLFRALICWIVSVVWLPIQLKAIFRFGKVRKNRSVNSAYHLLCNLQS